MNGWRLCSGLGLAVVGTMGVALILALASAGSGGVSAVATCNTNLAQAAGANTFRLTVADPTGCDVDDWIVIAQGYATQECHQIRKVIGNWLYTYYPLLNDHWVDEPVLEISECPTPPVTPTPTPTPTAGEMGNCPQAGKWAIAVWDGPDGVDTGEALATCEEEVDFAYDMDPDSQQWLGWFAGRPELTKLLTLKDKQGLIAHGKATLPTARIAFASSRDGNEEIYAMNPDGSGQTRLTYHPANDNYAAWSPDRSKIAFASDRDGNYEIYVMNADGTGQTRLTNNPAHEELPAWSPDGTRIAFSGYRDGELEIYVMNADGTGQTPLTTNPAYDLDPAWSPDGAYIAFASDRDGGNLEIYVMNADGSGQVRLTYDPAHDFYPAWSPDGTRIAFQSERYSGAGPSPTPTPAPTIASPTPRLTPTAGSLSEIWVMKANGTGVTNLTNNPAYVDESPAWSP